MIELAVRVVPAALTPEDAGGDVTVALEDEYLQ